MKHTIVSLSTQAQALVMSCQEDAQRLAYRYAHCVDNTPIEDLVSIALLRACEVAEKATCIATDPHAYVCQAMRFAVVDHFLKGHDDLLKRPMHKRHGHILSLEAPLADGFCLGDLVGEEVYA